MSYFDFNDAQQQSSFEPIPKGTLVVVRLTIRPGGYDDPSQGWMGGYARHNDRTGSIYLDCEFIVLEGEYVRRKLWSLIGLYSPKGPEWSNMGRAFIKAMLHSARRIHPESDDPSAQAALRLSGFAELDGLEFLAQVDWENDQHGQPKSAIKRAITPEHKDYARLMGVRGVVAQPVGTAVSPPIRTGRPSWAE